MDHRPKPRVLRLQRQTLAWRRNLVSILYLSGCHTVDTIVAELKERYDIEVSVSTVSNDLAVMRGLYKDRAAHTMEEVVDREVQKLDLLESIAAERSQPSSYILGLEDAGEEDIVAAIEKAQDDASRRDDKFIEQMLKIQDRRSRLLGLDKPTRVELGGPNGGAIPVHNVSDAELERIAAGRRA